MAQNELDMLGKNTIEFKAETINESGDLGIPLVLLGSFPAVIIALITLAVNGSDLAGAWEGGVFLWSLAPFLNVLGIWPLFYKESMERKLKNQGHKQKVTYWTALKSWYRIPFLSKKKVLQNTYVKVYPHLEHKMHGNLKNSAVSMGEATHEATDYLVSDAKGLRMERHLEPTPLMLWQDALNTVDEGFGLKKIYR